MHKVPNGDCAVVLWYEVALFGSQMLQDPRFGIQILASFVLIEWDLDDHGIVIPGCCSKHFSLASGG